MEDAEALLGSIVEFARGLDGLDAVVQTGSRARGQRVDEFSDLDIELIGPGSADLVGRDDWLRQVGEVLVNIHLANEEDDAPDWPTCLAVFAGGRKVDFTLAGPGRLEVMKREGLDDLYRRGYLVVYDPDGIAADLPPALPWTPPESPPEGAFVTNQREFWFEATQVPIYVARGDLWPAQLRLAGMRELALTMLTWHTNTVDATVDTWHNGHHLEEWLDPIHREWLTASFPSYDPTDMAAALRRLVDGYAAVTSRLAGHLGLSDLGLRSRVTAHIAAVSRTG